MKRSGIFVAIMVAIGCARSVPAPTTQTKSAVLATAIKPTFLGEGSLEAQGERTAKTKLALEKLSITAVTTGDVAEMTIEHEFRNDADEQLEGTFRFPLPDGAMLTRLSMEIDGKLMDGELVEREKARKAYEEIVDQMLDPALLEWENGHTFKLRVFPIEAKKTKRVVLQVVAPLHRAKDGLYFAYRAPASDGGLTLEKVRLTLDGKPTPMKRGTGEALVKVADVAPEALVERTNEGQYLLAHVQPSFDGAPPAAANAKAQAVILLCDRSRSMLEARALQVRTASLILGALDARDRFTVITGDVQARTFGSGLHPTTAEEKTAAAAFLDGVEPDGASDLGKLLAAGGEAAKQARAAGLEPVFVYLGDATPTWGETRASELETMAKDLLGGASLHAVVLGKSTDEATARALTAATHARLLRPKTEDDARRVAEQVVTARATRRIDDVKVVTADGVDVPAMVPSTIFDGDDVTIAAFVPKDKEAAATELKITGSEGGRPFVKTIGFASATPARDVGKRWAKARIEKLEREGDAHKEDVVKTSLEHGVMSRYTSFLVLESEEAYARMQIARKAKHADAAEATVSGKDLESADGRSASVSPDHLQPGDPEVRIPAPADAQSVVVLFPFGETKNAVFEQDEHGGSWVARFLVDAHTPDGTYEITIRITHRDGRVEILTVPYVVDTKTPDLDVVIEPKANGSYVIRAKQKLDADESRRPQVYTDAKRVEVRAPDGQVLSLVHVRLGEFVGTWRPTSPVARGSKMRLVAVDRALNERALEVEVP